MTIKSFLKTGLLWLAWAVIILSFQQLVSMRLDLVRPDISMDWTATETLADSHADKPYLIEPFMNNQVAWDSELYLSIALSGYSDPLIRSVSIPGGKTLAISHAFMPFYPLTIRMLAAPLQLTGLAPIPAATLAGVMISLLGTLAGMLALYDLALPDLGEAGGLRAAFYLVVFPAGFFLAQVYSEGLFIGLAFGSLALLRRRHFALAAILAVLAAWTRAVGVALVIPMVLEWLKTDDWIDLDMEWDQIFLQGVPWKPLGRAVGFFSPLIAFFAWKFSYLGSAFSIIENNFFGRGFLSLGTSFYTWSQAWASLSGVNTQRAAYYVIEFLAIGLGLAACGWLMRRKPEIALFSLAVLLLSLTSGPAQGMHRYVMGGPAVFLALAAWGRSEVFDRAWTLLSILLMGLLAALFTFNFWAG